MRRRKVSIETSDGGSQMAGVELAEHSRFRPLSFVCRELYRDRTKFKEGERLKRWVEQGINESWPRTITRHEGRKSVTSSDKLPFDLWRQPLELSVRYCRWLCGGGAIC